MNDGTTTYQFDSVHVKAWRNGWQRTPWSGKEVFGAMVHFTRGTDEYFVQFYGSIHEAARGEQADLREAVAMAAGELAWYHNDPEEFTRLLLDGVNAGNFSEKRDIIERFEEAEAIAGALADWLEASRFDDFEEWFEGLPS